MVADARPEAQLTLLDGAPAMVEKAAATLGPRAVAALVQDFSEPLPAGPFDAVVSSLAIHHLDDAGKASLYTRVRDVLRPRGVFVNAEQVPGATPALDALLWRWHEREARALGATHEEWVAAVERMTHDRCAGVETNLELLRAAGLEDVWCTSPTAASRSSPVAGPCDRASVSRRRSPGSGGRALTGRGPLAGGELFREALHRALVRPAQIRAHQRGGQPFAERRLLPGVLENDPGTSAGQVLERIGAGGDPPSTCADVALDDRRRVGRDDFDVDRVRPAAGADLDSGLGADPAVGAGVLPLAHHVVRERLVIGHHVEQVVDLIAGS